MWSTKQLFTFSILAISLLAITLIMAFAPLKTQAKDLGELKILAGEKTASLVNCFNYYKPNSVYLKFKSDGNEFKAGDTIKFSGEIENTNSFPITQGSLFVQALRKADSNTDKDSQPDYLVDEFFAMDNITLNAKEKRLVNFEWKSPQGISGGKYILGSHFVINRSMYLTGIPFNENSYKGPAYFNLASNYFDLKADGAIKEALIDKNAISINGSKLDLLGSLKQYDEKVANIAFESPINNLSTDQQEVEISKKVFYWDNLDVKRLIKEDSEKVKIDGNGKYVAKYSTSKLSPGSYLYEITAKVGEVKSIAKARFVINGKRTPARLAFVGLGTYPLLKNKQSYIFNCFQAVSANSNFDGKVYLTLRDNENNVLQRTEYDGAITPRAMAIKHDFLPDKDYYELTLEANVYSRDGEAMDSAIFKYGCNEFSDEIKEIKIETDSNKDEVRVYGVNSCNAQIKADIKLEVIGPKEKIVLPVKEVNGKELVQRVNFRGGNTYRISAQVGSLKKSIEFTSTKPNYDWLYYLLGGIAFIWLGIWGVLKYIKQQQASSHFATKL